MVKTSGLGHIIESIIPFDAGNYTARLFLTRYLWFESDLGLPLLPEPVPILACRLH